MGGRRQASGSRLLREVKLCLSTTSRSADAQGGHHGGRRDARGLEDERGDEEEDDEEFEKRLDDGEDASGYGLPHAGTSGRAGSRSSAFGEGGQSFGAASGQWSQGERGGGLLGILLAAAFPGGECA